MGNKNKVVFVGLSLFLPICLVFFSILNLNDKIEMYYQQYFIYFSIVFLCGLIILFMAINKNKLIKICYLLVYIISIILFLYSLLYKYNLLQYFNSVTKLKNFILSTKGVGIFVFLLLQIGQVVLLPIPAIVLAISGSLIYGPFLAILICSLGIVIGSVICFLLGKTFGVKLAYWLIGEDKTNKFGKSLEKNGKLLLFATFILPFFPDDAICFVAGVSKIKFKDFFIICAFTRPIGVCFLILFSGGHIIPFTGWGLWVWGVALLAIIVLIIVIVKYKTEIKSKLSKTKILKILINN